MGDAADHDKLTRALARLVQCRKDVAEHREKLRAHASQRLDGVVHAISSSAKAMGGEQADNVLVHRFHRTQLVESQRLRAIEGRGAPHDGDSG